MAYSQMQYIRDTYGVPARRGARVEYCGDGDGSVKLGTVTSTANTCGIRIRLDGEKRSRSFHPTWALRYLTPNARLSRHAALGDGEND